MTNDNGIIVALLGPDGAGKTAIGDQLQLKLKTIFQEQTRFHLRPRFLWKSNGSEKNAVTNPHGKASRGVILSFAKLIYFWLDYALGYLLYINPLKKKGHFVLFDRYYYDVLIDTKRYRYSGPVWIVRFVGWFIPEPDLYIILDAPPEIIHARKQEVPLEETRKQRCAYLKFAEETPNTFVLNTEQTLEETVNEALTVIQKKLVNKSKVWEA